MPTETTGFETVNNFTTAFGAKAFIILFLVFYIMFAIILYRQVQIMCRKLPSPISPHLRFISIINIGVSIAILFLIIGLF